METTEPKVLKIFYCYARKDKPLRDEMDLHLSALKRQNSVITWADHEIAPGEDWAKDINRHLNDADIIFLLVSPNFMGSDYCYGIEMRRALERHEQKQARVIPIILRPVDWEDAPFSNLQVLPTNAQPVTGWPDHDAAFADIVKNLRPMIKTLRNQLKTKEDWLAEAETLLAQDAHKGALEPLNQALAFDQNFVLALIYRGGAYKQLSDYQKAIIDFDHALPLDPKNPTILMLRGDAYRLQGEYPKALSDLNQALALKPDDAMALARRGETHRIMSNYEKALVDLNQALKLAPDDTFALTSRGDTHRFIGNYKQALADFDRVLSLDRHNATILTKRGDTYRLMKDYKNALTDFDEALALSWGFSDALARRGDTYRMLGEYDKTLSDRNKEIDGENALRLLTNAVNYRIKALADLNKALEIQPDNPWALVARAETYRGEDQYREALSDFNRAIALDEDDWYKYKRATLYFLRGERENQANDLVSAIELARSRSMNAKSTPDRWRSIFNIALYYFLLGNLEAARELYEHLVSICTLSPQLESAAEDLKELQKIITSRRDIEGPARISGAPTLTTAGGRVLSENELIVIIHEQILKRLVEIEPIVE